MLSQTHRTILLTTACDSIRHGLETGTALRVDAGRCEAPLGEPGASFARIGQPGTLSQLALRPVAGTRLSEDIGHQRGCN